MRGTGADNVSLVNVTMINPYMAVDLGTECTGRHYVNGLYAHAQEVHVTRENKVDLHQAFSTSGAVAYAFAYFDSELAQTAHFAFGSNDSAAVWINGKQVHAVWSPEGREAVPGGDQFDAPIEKGLNRLLVKVEDAAAGRRWEFLIEAYTEDGKPLGARSRD